MAGKSARIKIDFLVNDKQLNASFMRAWKRADTFGKRMDLIAGRMQSFGRTMTVGVTLPIVAGLTLATKAAIDEQKEMALLEQALVKNAHATKAQVAATEQWITKTQNWSGIADGELRPALAALVRSIKDTGKAQELLGIAMDISVAKGKPLQTVSEAIAKAYAGNTTALGRLGIRMKDAEGKTLSFEQVMSKAKDTFGGAAAKAADTTAGRLAILKAKLADMVEEVGTNLIPLVETGADVVGDLAEAFNRLSPSAKKAAVYAALVTAAIGPTSYLVGGGIKVVLRLADAYKAVAKWAGLAAAAEGGVGGKGARGTGKVAAAGTKGATAGGTAAAVGSLSPAAVSAITAATVAAVAASPFIIGKIVEATVGNKRYGGEEGGGGKRAIITGGPKGGMSGGGYWQRYKQQQAEIVKSAHSADAAIAALSAKAATATGKQFDAIRERMMNIQQLVNEGFEFGDIDAKHTDGQLRSIRDRIQGQLNITRKAADRIMATMFKDWRPLPVVMGKVSPAMAAAEKRIAQFRAIAGKPTTFGRADVSGLLNDIGRVAGSMYSLAAAGRTAAQAVSNALARKAGGTGGGRLMASGGAFMVRRATTFTAGERSTEIAAFIPTRRGSDQSRALAQLSAQLTAAGIGGSGRGFAINVENLNIEGGPYEDPYEAGVAAAQGLMDEARSRSRALAFGY